MTNATRIWFYLFETKSIQSYLTKSGKLRDIISISDALDKLIDSDKESCLYKVVEACGLKHNILHSNDCSLEDGKLVFFRCKGGAFSCYSTSKDAVASFRSAWTLFFEQAFPYMMFTDTIKEVSLSENNRGEDFNKGVCDAYADLAASINSPVSFFPISSAIIQSSPRTGLPAVKINLDDSRFKNRDILAQDLISDRFSRRPDQNSRIIYNKFMFAKSDEDNQTLAEQFLKMFLKNTCSENEDNDPDLDIALIHLDGNSIGNTLTKIREILKQASDETYTYMMRKFSDTISECTVESVKLALKDLYEQNDRKIFLFRPIVLGGDDVTLMISPSMAADFCIKYTTYFETKTKEALFNLNKEFKEKGGTDTFTGNIENLTASGGVLYQKSNHPYSNCISLTEELADKAKALTKDTDQYRNKSVGPAAVAMFRISSSTIDELDDLFSRSREFIYSKNSSIISGVGAYFVKSAPRSTNLLSGNFLLAKNVYNSSQKERTIEGMQYFVNDVLGRGKTGSMIHGVLRRMLSAISYGNIEEAKQLYARMIRNLEDRENKDVLNELDAFFNNKDFHGKFSEVNESRMSWVDYCLNDDNKTVYYSIIEDILIMYHYSIYLQNLELRTEQKNSSNKVQQE